MQPYVPPPPPPPAPSLLFPEDYCWVDRQGRPVSPPQPPRSSSRQTPSATERTLRKVSFDLGSNDNLGLMIRGGLEYGLGIFVTGIDDGSIASRHGIQPGDEICEVNGRPFDCLTHDEAVRVLKYNHRLSLVLRDVGKVPLQQQQQPPLTASSSKGSGSTTGGSASTLASLWSPQRATSAVTLAAAASAEFWREKQQQRQQQQQRSQT